MPREKDKFWEYFAIESLGKVRCRFCEDIFSSSSITRMKYHLAGVPGNDVRRCSGVPDQVRVDATKALAELDATKNKKARLQIGSSKASVGSSASNSSPTLRTTGSISSLFSEDGSSGGQQKIMAMLKKKEKETADLDVMSMIVANNLSFNLLRSEEFKRALASVGKFGQGYIPPSYETGRTKLLATLKGRTEEYVNIIKESWESSGCTLMSDSWTDARKRPHVNLLACSPKGTIFLKSECTVGRKKDASYIANFIISGIEEIGAGNVVQFISDNGSNYVAAGYIIEAQFPTIFKTSCAAHCIDLILEQIDELEDVKPILASARNIARFMYKFQHVLDLMRSHTHGRELKRPGATRFATQFLCLHSVIKEEQALRNMLASSEWRALPQSKSDEGMEISTVIQGNLFWEMGRRIILVVEPLVRVLRMVDGEGSTMCYLYEAMNRAKEGVKKAFNDDASKFMPYWEIIDKRWNETLYSPLHAFAGYVNPYLFYHKLVKMDVEVKNAIDKVKSKMVPMEERKNFTNDLRRYHSRDPKIFVESAIDLLDTSAPRVWWDMFGIEIPTLQKVAIKLCSQPSSASGCERNWSAFDAAHTKKRNRLEPKKMHDLVYVRMNMHFMKTTIAKEAKDAEPIFLDRISAFPEDLGDDEDEVFLSSDSSDNEAEEDSISEAHFIDDNELPLD